MHINNGFCSTSFSGSNLSQLPRRTALEAFSNVSAADASIAEMAQAFRRRRDLVVTRMKELMPGVPFVYPRGAFYLFFRVDHLFDGETANATAWCSDLLQTTGVALVPGAAFGDDRWVRMSYAASDAVLEDALERIAGYVNGA